MDKVYKNLKVIIIIATILIPIFILIILFEILTEVTAVKIDSINEKDIIYLANKNNIILKGEMELIGLKQKLGDWDLYIRYKDGNTDFISLNDRCSK